MSDERDETRRYPPADGPAFDDRTRAGGQPADDRTRYVGPPVDDRTQAAGPVDERTRFAGPPVDDRTRAGRPDATSVLPPSDDDWAPSRANPVWSGRAEVRSPQPGRSSYDTDWATGPVPPQRDRWWMPILVGTLVLILLAALGWGIYLIVQNSGRRPAPGPVPGVTVGTTAATTPSAEATTPSTEPTTTSPSPAPSATVPTTVATVPALRGMALADARAALARTGLKSRLIFRDSDAPPNTVIDSDPAEGQEVPPDTTVTLVVARSATTGPTTTPTATPAGEAGGD